MNKLYQWMDNHTPYTMTRKPWHWLWSLPILWLINFNLFNVEFRNQLDYARQNLLRNAPDTMLSFGELFAKSIDRNWFIGAALVAVANAVWMYYSHRQNSQSVYLMRRLPDRWEYHRRCLTLPICLLIGDAIAFVTLYGVCQLVYVKFVADLYMIV